MSIDIAISLRREEELVVRESSKYCFLKSIRCHDSFSTSCEDCIETPFVRGSLKFLSSILMHSVAGAQQGRA